MFRSLRKNLRLASDTADKVKRMDEQTRKLSDKFKEQGSRYKELQSVVSNQAGELAQLVRSTENLQMICGKIAASQLASKPAGTPFSEVEFKVYSQWGEDGIIQHLTHHLKPAERTFVEFGVETYTEASTRFLLANDNWRGLIIDGSEDNIRTVKQSELYWKHDLTAIASFITPSNINEIIRSQKFGPRVGILSVDIDGMDYWVLKAIEVEADILICEYNSLFGPEAMITVPPKDDFHRTSAHHSNLFYGMSLAAATQIAQQKGYDLVGCNSAGNNAFFVNRKLASPFPVYSPAECFVMASFREGRAADGSLTFLGVEARRQEIADVIAFDLNTNSERKVKDILG